MNVQQLRIPRETARLALLQGRYLRDYALRFLLECMPGATLDGIRDAVFSKMAS